MTRGLSLVTWVRREPSVVVDVALGVHRRPQQRIQLIVLYVHRHAVPRSLCRSTATRLSVMHSHGIHVAGSQSAASLDTSWHQHELLVWSQGFRSLSVRMAEMHTPRSVHLVVQQRDGANGLLRPARHRQRVDVVVLLDADACTIIKASVSQTGEPAWVCLRALLASMDLYSRLQHSVGYAQLPCAAAATLTHGRLAHRHMSGAVPHPVPLAGRGTRGRWCPGRSTPTGCRPVSTPPRGRLSGAALLGRNRRLVDTQLRCCKATCHATCTSQVFRPG